MLEKLYFVPGVSKLNEKKIYSGKEDCEVASVLRVITDLPRPIMESNFSSI